MKQPLSIRMVIWVKVSLILFLACLAYGQVLAFMAMQGKSGTEFMFIPVILPLYGSFLALLITSPILLFRASNGKQRLLGIAGCLVVISVVVMYFISSYLAMQRASVVMRVMTAEETISAIKRCEIKTLYGSSQQNSGVSIQWHDTSQPGPQYAEFGHFEEYRAAARACPDTKVTTDSVFQDR